MFKDFFTELLFYFYFVLFAEKAVSLKYKPFIALLIINFRICTIYTKNLKLIGSLHFFEKVLLFKASLIVFENTKKYQIQTR